MYVAPIERNWKDNSNHSHYSKTTYGVFKIRWRCASIWIGSMYQHEPMVIFINYQFMNKQLYYKTTWQKVWYFLTIFNEGAYLSQSSIRPSIYFSSIVKSRSNPFLEPTSTKQYCTLALSFNQQHHMAHAPWPIPTFLYIEWNHNQY